MNAQERTQISGTEPESVARQMVRNYLALRKRTTVGAESCVSLMMEFNKWLVSTNETLQKLVLDKVNTSLPAPILAAPLPQATPQTDPLREFSHDQAERDFLNVSIAVWREIDRLMKLGPYPGIHMATDLRISEKLAWERYRAFLDKDECKCVPCPKCGGQGANLTDAPNKEPTDSEVCGECGGSGEIETCSYCRGLLEENV